MNKYSDVYESFGGNFDYLSQNVKEGLVEYLNWFGILTFEEQKQKAYEYFQKCFFYCFKEGIFNEALKFANIGIELTNGKANTFNYLDNFLCQAYMKNSDEDLQSCNEMLQYLIETGKIYEVKNSENISDLEILHEVKGKLLDYLIINGSKLSIDNRIDLLSIMEENACMLDPEDLYNTIIKNKDYIEILIDVCAEDLANDEHTYVEQLFVMSNSENPKEQIKYCKMTLQKMTEYALDLNKSFFIEEDKILENYEESLNNLKEIIEELDDDERW